MNFLKAGSLGLQLILNFLIIFYFVGDFRTSLYFEGLTALQLFHKLKDSLFVEVDQANMFFKIFKFLVDPLLLHLEAVIIFEFYKCPVGLNFIDQGLILVVYVLDVFDPSELHGLEQLVPVFHKILGDV